MKLDLIETPALPEIQTGSRASLAASVRSSSRRLIVLAPRQNRRWMVNALARRPEYLDYEFSFQTDESSTETVIVCVAGTFQQLKELHRRSTIRLVLLDAIEGIGNCRHEILAALERGWIKDVLYVGNLGLRTTEFLRGWPCDLLFDQTANYNDQGSGISRIGNRFLMIKRGRHNLYRLGLTSFIKDAITHPSKSAQLALGKKRAVFAGRDGIDPIKLLLTSINYPPKGRDSLVHEIETTGIRVSKAPIDDISWEFARLFANAYHHTQPFSRDEVHHRAMRCILFKALHRFFSLSYLSNRTNLVFLDYPNYYLRVYESPIYRRHKFLDFGGAYGFESIYPRTSDLCMSGADYLQVDQQKMRAACESSSAKDWAVCLKEGVHTILSVLADRG